MAEDNLSAPAEPVATTPPPTEESLVEDISNLLEPPETDQPEEPEEAAAAPAEDDDPLGLGAEDVDPDTADTGDESDEPEIKGGRFAPDSAKVTLDDGTVTTIAELKRGTLFQRDYTRKTQELSEERKSFEAQREQVSQYAQQLDQSREYLAWYAEQFIPKQPPATFQGDARMDPQGFLEWQQDVARWQAHAQTWQQFQQSKQDEEQRKSGETQKQQQERIKREGEALFKAIPVLKDPVKGKQVWDNIVAGAGSLGFSAEEVNGITDHRMVLALRKAIAYDRIKASAPKVQAEGARRPVVNTGRRAAPNAAQNREKQARTERLRNSGTFDDGVASLMDFDL
jgi:hypothetical protein